MSQQIQPHKISTPIGLMASLVVALLGVQSAELVGAVKLENHPALCAVLVIAAVCNYPLFLVYTFMLQTRFRRELLSDAHYAKARTDELKHDQEKEARVRLGDAILDFLAEQTKRGERTDVAMIVKHLGANRTAKRMIKGLIGEMTEQGYIRANGNPNDDTCELNLPSKSR